MTITLIGTTVTALAIKADKFALFTHPGLPAMALVGVSTAMLSPVLHLSDF